MAIQSTQEAAITAEPFLATLRPFIFSGVLLGLLPMWNSAVFIAAAAILGLLFILCPLRLQMLVLAVTSGLIALPQMLYSEPPAAEERICQSSFIGATR